MKLYNGFNEKWLRSIALRADNKQLVRDVSYGRLLNYHKPNGLYCEFIDDIAFILCEKKVSSIRIVCIGTSSQHKKKGLATFLLKRLIKYAKQNGYGKIYKRSLSGADFYLRRGFDIVGMKQGDYLLEMNLD